MTKKIKSMEELRDSQLLFDKQPPAFGYLMTCIVLAALIAAVLWAAKTPKYYTIEAHGTVTNENAEVVMCTYTGELTECEMQEGLLVEEGQTLFRVKSTDYDLQEQQLLASRSLYEERFRQYEKLVNSIKTDQNLFDESNPEETLYYSAFQAYKAQLVQAELDTSAYTAYGYSEEQIEAELLKNQGKISEIYYNAIQSAENAAAEAEAQISSLDAQLSAVQSGQGSYAVKATESGTLHLTGPYKDGVVVQTGTTVATIVPAGETLVLEAYVSTTDMARMHTNDAVQIVVDGLAQNVYGTLSGAVKQIDSNLTVQQDENGSSVQSLRIIVAINGDYLVSQSGDKVNLVNGMTAVARIQYDRISYLQYFLEKIGFKAR